MVQDRHPKSPQSTSTDNLPVAAVVHDMNQLFGVIMGRAGKLLAADPSPQLKLELEAILLAAKDAAAMARRLNDNAVGAGEGDWSLALDQVVVQAAILAASDEDRQKWPVVIDIPANLFATISGQVLREVLNNLLRNAQTVMPDGGQLEISARLSGENIHLQVIDQGPGLAPGAATKIFEVGFTTSGQEGRGIGLPASRMLLQSCGGDLIFVPSLDTGAIFELIIPVGEMVSAPQQPVAELSGTSVLVVDDDQAMREMLSDVLGALGCQVVTTRDATSALAQMIPCHFQIALLDQNLPGMKGIELARKLRKTDPLISLVLITGWGNEDLNLDGEESPIDLLARKPLEFGAIRDLIGQSLKLRQIKEQLPMKEHTE